jgi:hypothetical protein
MGVDVCIFFKATHEFEGTVLPACASTVPVNASAWSCEWREEVGIDATHEVEMPGRVFKRGYERGDWPLHAAVLVHLLACPHIEKIWYGGDNGAFEVVTLEFVTHTNEYFIEYYRQGEY